MDVNDDSSSPNKKKKGSFYRLRKQTHHNDYKFVRSINIKSAASGISDRTEEHLIRT